MEAWEYRKDEERVADSLPTFIIFCEDEVSEPEYFRSFQTDFIKVNPIGKQKSKIINVLNAIAHCVNEGLTSVVDGKHTITSNDINVWCVFDRDGKRDDEGVKFEDISFNEAIETAQNKGIKVAWSNDAFELWVLLHFEDVDPNVDNTRERTYYYDRLTDIFQNMPNQGKAQRRLTDFMGFYYKTNMKGKTNFKEVVLPSIIDNTITAIQRAKSLVTHHNQFTDKALHEKAPCTMVHELVEELIRLGKKKEYLHLIE